LRVASRFEVGFIAEPLIVKRGGHHGQLSQSEWGIDRYRVAALVKIYEAGVLEAGWRETTRKLICAKCEILENGFRKRQKLAEAAFYADLKRRLRSATFDAAENGSPT
jgi:hypothetical protein